MYRLVIKKTLNNVFVYLNKISTGEVITLQSAGTLGFTGPKKTTNVTAEKLAALLELKSFSWGSLKSMWLFLVR